MVGTKTFDQPESIKRGTTEQREGFNVYQYIKIARFREYKKLSKFLVSSLKEKKYTVKPPRGIREFTGYKGLIFKAKVRVIISLDNSNTIVKVWASDYDSQALVMERIKNFFEQYKD